MKAGTRSFLFVSNLSTKEANNHVDSFINQIIVAIISKVVLDLVIFACIAEMTNNINYLYLNNKI